MDELALNAAMDRYACGEAPAFRILFESLYPRLVAYLTRMSGSTSLAADLVQETFLRMHRARATFTRGASVLPWAYAIARNVHLDHARAAKFRKTERLPSDPGLEPVDAGAADGESQAIAIEVARVVEQALDSLPPAQREAFVLLRYEGLSVDDAASVLGTTASAVKLRAFRAYEALRGALAEARTSKSKEGAPSPPAADPSASGGSSALRAERQGANKAPRSDRQGASKGPR